MVKSLSPDKDELWQAASLHEKTADWIMRSRVDPVQTEADMDDWLAEDDANIEAYAEGLLIWEQLGQVAPDWPSERVLKKRRINISALMMALTMVVLCALGIGFGYNAYMFPTYSTKIGEQRTVHLSDGTNVMLNTRSVMKLHYERGLRRVDLVQGEAFFDVAPNKQRPFIVEAGGSYVRAIGTSFVVRSDKDSMEVTLLSGRVDVGRGHFNASPERSLIPGDRFRKTASSAVIDRPRLEGITAWRNGEIMLNEMPLTQAVAEMNRYSKKPIILNSRNAGDRKMSGIVRIDEPDVFVSTVAGVYGLKVTRSDTSTTISGEVSQ